MKAQFVFSFILFAGLLTACSSTPLKEVAHTAQKMERMPATNMDIEGEWRGSSGVSWGTSGPDRILTCLEMIAEIKRLDQNCADSTSMYSISLRCEDEYLSEKAQNIFRRSANVCSSEGKSRWQMLEVGGDESSQLRFSLDPPGKTDPRLIEANSDYLTGLKFIQISGTQPSLLNFNFKREKRH